MKKKVWLILLTAVLLLAILFAPIPKGPYEDGGTRVYSALTYKIVDWSRITDDGIYEARRVYFFPYNLRSIDDLWQQEVENVVHCFTATVLEIDSATALVSPIDGEPELQSSSQFLVSSADLGDIGATAGSVVDIYYQGGIMESAPAQIHAVKWALSGNLRHMEYPDQWLDKSAIAKYDVPTSGGDVVITEIYKDCFFARTVIPLPHEYKINGSLSDDWCVGDQVLITYENIYYDDENNRMEADLLTIEVSTFQLDDTMCYKPVIYLYPETETEISVALTLNGQLTCTYPAYENGWRITASPDGTLTDAVGQTYNYLYWEGTTNVQWDMTKGFCVKGEDTAAFLEDALAQLGLTRREANEFIVYWLPLMQDNPYNIISFQEYVYTNAAQLSVDPAPDTLIRVFMTWQASGGYVNLPAQTLTAPERTGFTVVEWGGTQIP